MPPQNISRNERPSPVKPSPARPPPVFSFPADKHLLITTHKQVLSWDKDAITPIFTSGSEGILAAKEAKDDTALLAIADSQVVILHDINGTSERSYRLKGTDGQIRLLEYASDSASLFFTTTLQNAVQIYSIQRSSLLDPAHTHPSPPTVLATTPKTSTSSQFLLSCSEKPPTIYLQNLTYNSPPVHIQPNASASPVDVAAFHPDRPNVFVLGFRDGTLAAYDATRLSAAPRGGRTQVRQPAEISHFKKLHAIPPYRPLKPEQQEKLTTIYAGAVRTSPTSITGVAFLSGYKTRAVSVGADGKCKIVDFDLGGKLLRTWHARAPATALSVLTLSATPVPRLNEKAVQRRLMNRSIDSKDPPDHLITIGRKDGKLVIFNSIGLLLKEHVADADGRAIAQVDWLDGPTSKPVIQEDVAEERVIDAPALKKGNRRKSGIKGLRKSKSKLEMFLPDLPDIPSQVDQSWVSLDANLEGNNIGTEPEVAEPYDESSGTVNYVPAEGTVTRGLPPVPSTNYMDLFSPVKQMPVQDASPQRRATRRVRPRLRSSTFTGAPEDLSTQDADTETQALLRDATETENDLPESLYPEGIPELTSNQGFSLIESESKPPVVKLAVRATPRSRKGRRISFRRFAHAQSGSNTSLISSSSTYSTPAEAVSNAQLLADLKRVGESGPGQRKVKLAFFAPYMPKTSGEKRSPPRSPPRTANPYDHHQKHLSALGEENLMPETSGAMDDIWFTSDDEDGRSHASRPRGLRKKRNRRSSGFSRKSQAGSLYPTDQIFKMPSIIRPRSSKTPSVVSVHEDEHEASDDETQHNTKHYSRPTVIGVTPGFADAVGGYLTAEDHARHESSVGAKVSNRLAPVLTPHVELTASSRATSQYGTTNDIQVCDCGMICCAARRSELRELQDQMSQMRAEMEEMKSLLRTLANH